MSICVLEFLLSKSNHLFLWHFRIFLYFYLKLTVSFMVNIEFLHTSECRLLLFEFRMILSHWPWVYLDILQQISNSSKGLTLFKHISQLFDQNIFLCTLDQWWRTFLRNGSNLFIIFFNTSPWVTKSVALLGKGGEDKKGIINLETPKIC